jgi:hypothetical protein
MNDLLRERLQQITLDLNVAPHAAQIDTLRAEIPHTESIRDGPAPNNRYTCAVHAFTLVEHPTYLAIAGFGRGETFAGKSFIEYLLKHGLLREKPEGSAEAGDLIIYVLDDEFSHVGRMTSRERVVSKWGTGLLYEHSIWEVPTNYGGWVHYYEGPNADESLELFLRYAETQASGSPRHERRLVK